MLTHSLPPPRASRIDNGYWVQAARMMYGRKKPSFKSIVAVSNYWYYNLRGFKKETMESNKVSNYYMFYKKYITACIVVFKVNTAAIQKKSMEDIIQVLTKIC